MNIFVTGGNGLIGKQICTNLINNGHNVVSFDKLKKRKNKKNIIYLKGDILNNRDLNKNLKKYKFDIFLHLAANLGVKNTERNSFDCLIVNIEGTKNILKACVKNKVKRFIFASSSEVYGNGQRKPISEDDELMPKSPYGVSKVAGESYVKAFNEKYGLKFNILRFFNVYGPDQRDDFVISIFKKNILKNKPIKIFGSGNQTRSFCHVKDAARAVELVIYKGKKNQIYNIGNDKEPTRIIDLAKKMIKISNKKVKIIKVPFNRSDRSIEREILLGSLIFKRLKNIQNIFPH